MLVASAAALQSAQALQAITVAARKGAAPEGEDEDGADAALWRSMALLPRLRRVKLCSSGWAGPKSMLALFQLGAARPALEAVVEYNRALRWRGGSSLRCACRASQITPRNHRTPPEVGEPAPAEVQPGRLQWAVPWDVLALELCWGAPGKYPDRVVVHRKGRGSRDGGGGGGGGGGAPAAHLLQCFPDTPQALQVKAVAGRVLARYCQDAARADRRWADRHAARAALPPGHPPQLLPLTLPSLDFQLVWHTNPARPPAVAFWRPVPPPGAQP